MDKSRREQLRKHLNDLRKPVSAIMDENFILTPTDEPTEAVVIITPSVARRLIAQTDPTKQRQKKGHRIKQYAEDMKNGQWILNYETMHQDVDGNMINGFTRLWACVEANTPFTTKMTKGMIYDDIMDTLDSGGPRTRPDILSLRVGNIKYYDSVSGAIEYIYQFSRGRVGVTRSRSDVMSNRRMRQWVDANKASVYELYEYAKTSYKRSEHLIPHKPFIGLYYIFNSIDEKAADVFMHRIGFGVDVPIDSPAFNIRAKLHRSKYSNTKSAKLTPREQSILMIRAWNDFYGNDDVMSRKNYVARAKNAPLVAGLSADTELYNVPEGWELDMLPAYKK